MKLIEIEELQEGDEIIISCQTFFKYLRVLSPPKKDNAGYYNRVKCSGRRTSIEKEWTDFNGQKNKYYIHKWECTPNEHNIIQYLDLQYRQILLINR